MSRLVGVYQTFKNLISKRNEFLLVSPEDRLIMKCNNLLCDDNRR